MHWKASMCSVSVQVCVTLAAERGDTLYLIALREFSLGFFEFIYTRNTHSISWQAVPQLNLMWHAEKSL